MFDCAAFCSFLFHIFIYMQNLFVLLLTPMLMFGGCAANSNDPVLDEASDSEVVEENVSVDENTPAEEEIVEEDVKTDIAEVEVDGDVEVVIHTNMGDMKVLLYGEKAPETVKNFLSLSQAGKYDGVIFHRVIKDFMIQVGDFENSNGTGGYSYKGPGTYLQDEFAEGLTHEKGTLSMANAGPNTGGSQFFIVQAEEGTAFLDGKHAIFGKVIEGLEFVDVIADVETGFQDRPVEDVVIESVEIL